MQTDLFRGELVRLKAADPQILGENASRWGRDSEYWRLMASEAAYTYSKKASQAFFEKLFEKDPPEAYTFLMYRLEDDRLLGDIELEVVSWTHGDAFVGLGIGERECWSKGYGTDAMRVILRYAFTELNLQRVTLTVFDYNTRAVRSYEKAGFKYEGREIGFMRRDGERRDMIWMGILKDEWIAQQQERS